MPVYTYTRDFRDQDGATSSATNVKENLGDIQDAINGLSWVNVDKDSLDQYHAAPGSQYKDIGGLYARLEPSSYPQHHPHFTTIGSISVPVRPDNAVYVMASASWDSSDTTNYPLAPRQIYLRLRSQATANGNQAGAWELSHGYNIESTGGGGIVWAYQVESGTEHMVYFEMSHSGPDSGFTVGRPARVNLVVFVIDR